MSTTDLSNGREEKFDLELYKLLKAESSSYFDKLQAIWLQKFVLVGAVIAFLATTQEKLPQLGQSLVIPAAALAIPVLSALLDAKIMEFGLHSRSISRFISTHYSDIANVASWEAMLWGSGASTNDLALVKARSLTTVLTAVIPTMVICLLSAVVLGSATGLNDLCLSLGFGVCLLYAAVTRLSWKLVWGQSRA
jgi:hypothetical protein